MILDFLANEHHIRLDLSGIFPPRVEAWVHNFRSFGTLELAAPVEGATVSIKLDRL